MLIIDCFSHFSSTNVKHLLGCQGFQVPLLLMIVNTESLSFGLFVGQFEDVTLGSGELHFPQLF